MTEQRVKVLVVDDEAPIRKFLRISLSANGYQVLEAATAAVALDTLEGEPVDLVLLDLGLPDEDGQDVILAIRAHSAVPIIVLSVRGGDQDKIRALDAGANDFVTKPFSIGELLARVRATLRIITEERSPSSELTSGLLMLDPARHRVEVDNRPVKLTPREFALLELLLRNPGKVMSHAALLRAVWGDEHTTDTHYLRIYISQLRQKLGDDPSDPRFIVNEPGVGYRLKEGD